MGHISIDCPRVSSEGAAGFSPSCSYCQGSHLGKDCPSRKGPQSGGVMGRGVGAIPKGVRSSDRRDQRANFTGDSAGWVRDVVGRRGDSKLGSNSTFGAVGSKTNTTQNSENC